MESNESDNKYSKNIYISSRGVTTTGTATGITKSSATLNGLVNPEGISTTVKFEYGHSTSYGNTVNAVQSPVSGYDVVNVSSNITGLAPYTLYHYRIVADNSYGTSYGGDSTFITLSDQAAASTSLATAISQSTATLNGIVNPNSLTTTVQFEYGTTAGYGSIVTASQSPVNGNVGVNVSADITGLAANTLYHFRIKASNAANTTYGADLTFKTKFFYPASFNLSQIIHLEILLFHPATS